MNLNRTVLLLMTVLIVSGCATAPPGPRVAVMPGPGKPFDQFQADDYYCRRWAEQQTGIAPSDAANQRVATGAALGTLMGAGLGAAIGAASGNAGLGAGIGAASGLVGGAAMSSGSAAAAGEDAQRRYDIAYQQCMYARGNDVPGMHRSVPPPPPPGYSQPPSGYNSQPEDYPGSYQDYPPQGSYPDYPPQQSPRY
jgi:hypothetical protein